MSVYKKNGMPVNPNLWPVQLQSASSEKSVRESDKVKSGLVVNGGERTALFLSEPTLRNGEGKYKPALSRDDK